MSLRMIHQRAKRRLPPKLPLLAIPLLLAGVALSPSSASAQTNFWIGGNASWFVDSNWSTGLVPDPRQSVEVNNGGRPTTSAGNAAAFSLILGQSAGASGSLSVPGFGASFPTQLKVGTTVVGADGAGSLSISSDGGGSAVVTTRDPLPPPFNSPPRNDTYIGLHFGSNGTATVTGANARWDILGFLSVGSAGTGTLAISNGGDVFATNCYIGDYAGSLGSATVTGASVLRARGELVVGRFGSGTLLVEAGGFVAADGGVANSGGGTTTIGSLGTLTLGTGGTLDSSVANNGMLAFNRTDVSTFSESLSGAGVVAHHGPGATTISNAATYAGDFAVNAGRLTLTGPLAAASFTANSGGTLHFDGSTLAGEAVRASAGGTVEYEAVTVNGGFLRGAGVHTILASETSSAFNAVSTFSSTNIIQDGPANFNNSTHGGGLVSNAPLAFDGVANAPSGRITVNSTLHTTDFTNSGVLTVSAGGAIANGEGDLVSGGGSRTTIDPGGTIELQGDTTLDLNGALLANNGTIAGTINVNYGSLATGTGEYGVVNVNRGGVFSPGNSPGIATAQSLRLTDAAILGASTLAIEIGGTAPGSEHDQVKVTGVLSLGGTLEASLVDFAPVAGQSFDILDWGSLSGTFATINLPALAGLQWDTSQLYTTGVLSVIAPGFLEADFDEDGDVDGDDLVQWQGDFDENAFSDADGDGDSDGADFLAWQRQLGSGAPAIASGAAVPEPGNDALAALALAALMAAKVRL